MVIQRDNKAHCVNSLPIFKHNDVKVFEKYLYKDSCYDKI